ncbi:MAG: Hpt domain-containing protein [Pseudomonadota bacterium]
MEHGLSYSLVVDTDEDLQLTQRYLARKAGQIAFFRECIAAENYEELSRSGHKLVGSGAAYGLPRITELGRELHLAAGNLEHSDCIAVIDRLAEFVARVEVTKTTVTQAGAS